MTEKEWLGIMNEARMRARAYGLRSTVKGFIGSERTQRYTGRKWIYLVCASGRGFDL